MNYFAHALPFLDDDPYFVAGTAVPDWLTVVDRKVRVRRKVAERFCAHPEPHVAAVARGCLQHIRDDARFHETRAFAELNLELTVLVRDALGKERGFRPSFLGHLLVEVLLDSALIEEDPGRLDAYYAALARAEPDKVQEAVNRMAPRPTDRLAAMVSGFCQARILSSYAEDGKLLMRLDQVARRVGFAELPDGFAAILPEARRAVAARKDELLDGIPA